MKNKEIDEIIKAVDEATTKLRFKMYREFFNEVITESLLDITPFKTINICKAAGNERDLDTEFDIWLDEVKVFVDSSDHTTIKVTFPPNVDDGVNLIYRINEIIVDVAKKAMNVLGEINA